MELLGRGLERPVSLVSAPAGFGKTSLLAAWRASREGSSCRLAWLTLDEGDNDPVRFWQYTISALDTVLPGIGEGVRSLLRSISQTPAGGMSVGWLEAAATGLINDLAERAADDEPSASPVLLVLDDYHAIRNQAIHDSVAFFIEYLPPYVHLVILSRADPPLPLARLRVRDQLIEIRVADLRFRDDEAEAFLNRVMGLDLPAEAVESLSARTEGWPAGLRLAALSLQGRDAQFRDRFIKDFKGTQHHVFSYLVEEVFNRQPPQVQDFLLRTCILSYLTAPLCDALLDAGAEATDAESDLSSASVARGAPATSGSQAMLTRLERENLFLLPLDEERRWYRYHPLFAEALRGRLADAEPGLVPRLHQRAAAWYETHGQVAEAVRHALSTGDWEHVGRLIEATYTRLVIDGEMTTLHAWLDALPAEIIQARPRLALAHAWAMGYSGPNEIQEQMLRWAEVALEKTSEPGGSPDPAGGDRKAENDRLRGEILALRATMESLGWESQCAIEYAQEAMWLLWPDSWAEFYQQPQVEPVSQEDLWLRSVILHALGNAYRLDGNVKSAEVTYREALRLTLGDGPQPIPAFPMMALVASFRLGQVLVSQGRLREAARVYRHAMDTVRSLGGELLLFSGEALIRLGEILAEQNRLPEAEDSIREGIELCRRAVNPMAELAGYLTLMRVNWAAGDAASARVELERAEQIVAFSSRAYPAPLVTAQRAWLDLVTGDIAAATCWAEDLSAQRSLEGKDPCIVHEAQDLLSAGVDVARGHFDEAQVILEQILADAGPAGRVGAVIEALAWQALAFEGQEDTEAARSTLMRAMILAEPEGYRRVFVDKGEPMRALIADCRMRNGAPVPAAVRSYLEAVLAAFPARGGIESHTSGFPKAETHKPQSGLIEPLTARELEILHLITEGASNQDIAARLVLSVGTVKGHINHILGKLRARNRTEAVARARGLGLIET